MTYSRGSSKDNSTEKSEQMNTTTTADTERHANARRAAAYHQMVAAYERYSNCEGPANEYHEDWAAATREWVETGDGTLAHRAQREAHPAYRSR